MRRCAGTSPERAPGRRAAGREIVGPALCAAVAEPDVVLTVAALYAEAGGSSGAAAAGTWPRGAPRRAFLITTVQLPVWSEAQIGLLHSRNFPPVATTEPAFAGVFGRTRGPSGLEVKLRPVASTALPPTVAPYRVTSRNLSIDELVEAALVQRGLIDAEQWQRFDLVVTVWHRQRVLLPAEAEAGVATTLASEASGLMPLTVSRRAAGDDAGVRFELFPAPYRSSSCSSPGRRRTVRSSSASRGCSPRLDARRVAPA